ncbi:methylated-DNA--[protein]-cysteine S-methyltransferase [Peptoniphilus stercorisuis]|uniref:Methylated-DNA--protein-cysteine methyltransferase n=1 Tax=Peptoniphilus stercorisuis TaxID=1436965 RepID=A0ABS4KBK8_9FIRM|nr:methylated-DNA--[protein]-cysteine S-methyltransferase [Peptoniphilus stercorisuis]MBP2024636.1 methylated-DNA-[protein]-cysteine S-methyltransferase [Peptoniphilus stercorisuis]
MIYTMNYLSPLGNIKFASDGDSLIGLWFEGQKYHGDTIFKEMELKEDLEIFKKSKKWIDSYFNKENPSIDDIPLGPIGGEFRKDVWKILCEIPYGETISYGEIAKKIAKKRNLKSMSAQAVGGAVGHNPVSIIIPCHRVVGSNGSLTGYASGVEKKIWLLEHEGLDLNKFKK